MATHNRTYIALFHTKKIFANMRRQGKDFSDEAVNEEPSMQLKELVGFCTKLQQRVLDLEITKVGRSARVVSFDEASLDMAEKGSSTLQKPVTTAGEKLKSARPKTKGMKKKDQIRFDEQEAIRLQAEFDEEVRLTREKDKANVALIEEWNDIQDKIETDYEMA
ncbi:hypothetical protein Tco_0704417 [Tanacetum coccineum]|uniref:Uncharacterized protein n=1 Tax=Tanacetum coccineum TaxID=301880 RepID=A0ABQ4Y1Z6_9ASTR